MVIYGGNTTEILRKHDGNMTETWRKYDGNMTGNSLDRQKLIDVRIVVISILTQF